MKMTCGVGAEFTSNGSAGHPLPKQRALARGDAPAPPGQARFPQARSVDISSLSYNWTIIIQFIQMMHSGAQVTSYCACTALP